MKLIMLSIKSKSMHISLVTDEDLMSKTAKKHALLNLKRGRLLSICLCNIK